MLRTVGVITALQLLAWSPAWACTGQVGTSIFQDSFSDDTGGWDESPPNSVVQPPNFVITLDANDNGWAAQNLTFNATNGDFCTDFVLPPAIAANNQLYAGIEFWMTDYQNGMVVTVGSNGSVWLQKLSAGNWSNIFSVQNSPAFNSAANAVNDLRVTAVSGLITVYLNGTQIKAVRAQEPTNPSLNFGMIGQCDTAVASPPPIQFKAFSVTAGK